MKLKGKVSSALELDQIRMSDATSPLFSTISTSSGSSFSSDQYVEEKLNTKFGTILVARQGADHKSGKPIILTYHDVGLNHCSNFESFFNISENKLLMQSFSIIHINAPGQEINADKLPPGYVFPTPSELALQIVEVCMHFAIKSFIGFGFGAGANILCRFALNNPQMVDGLFLVNCPAGQSSWTEWFYQKLNIRSLTNFEEPNSDYVLPQSVQDYLIWHLFSNLNFPDREIDNEAVELYRNYFASNSINKYNLSLFIDSYIKRDALGISRDNATTRRLKCNVLLLCGNYSPHVEETVEMNSRLDPSSSTWMKLSEGSMVLEEQPHKVAEGNHKF